MEKTIALRFSFQIYSSFLQFDKTLQQLLPLFEAQTNSSEFEIVNCDHLVKNYGMLTAMTTGLTNSYDTELSRIKAIILILGEILPEVFEFMSQKLE